MGLLLIAPKDQFTYTIYQIECGLRRWLKKRLNIAPKFSLDWIINLFILISVCTFSFAFPNRYLYANTFIIFSAVDIEITFLNYFNFFELTIGI